MRLLFYVGGKLDGTSNYIVIDVSGAITVKDLLDRLNYIFPFKIISLNKDASGKIFSAADNPYKNVKLDGYLTTWEYPIVCPNDIKYKQVPIKPVIEMFDSLTPIRVIAGKNIDVGRFEEYNLDVKLDDLNSYTLFVSNKMSFGHLSKIYCSLDKLDDVSLLYYKGKIILYLQYVDKDKDDDAYEMIHPLLNKQRRGLLNF